MSTRALIPATTLRGRWLIFTRAAWGVIAALAVGLFAASIPAYASNVLRPGQSTWVARVEAPARLVFTLDLFGVLASLTAVLVCLTLAVVLIWRRSNDWMVVFVSSYLLLYGTIMAGPLEWTEGFYVGRSSIAVYVVQSLLLTTPTVALFVLFPDGRLIPRWTRWLIPSSIPLGVAIPYLPLFYSGAFWYVMVSGAIYAQVYRYRNVSTPVGRQQT